MARGARRRLATFAALVLGACTALAGQAGATTIPMGAVDMTGSSSAEITFAPYAYSPNLLAVGRSGGARADLTWSGAFSSHPLRFEDTSVSGNDDGASATRQLRSGRYAYFCAFHGSSFNMRGTVYIAGPRAALTATPADVAPGGTVKLDAAGTDLVSFGSASATYAFDPEGDGTFLPAGSATSVQATYPTQGTVAARVRVTDDAGRVDEAAFDVDVFPPGTGPPPGPGDPPRDPAKPGDPATTTGPGAGGSNPRTAVKFADVATLPVVGRCVKRRSGVRITVRDRTGADVRRVRVLVNGRTARRVTVGRRATLTLRPLPRGRPLVKVVVTLAGGKSLSRSTRYRTCS